MFSILIPTYKNFEYLKICIKSLKKNSIYNNQIIVHINTEDKEVEKFLNDHKITYTKSVYNFGMPKSLNTASMLAIQKYIVISHDDFYYCPNWDEYLMNAIKESRSKFFLYTGLMIGPKQPLECNYGETYKNFNESKLIKNYNIFQHYDFTGSTKHPAVLKKELWDRVGGWSEEFYPTGGDDTDFLVKLWNVGVRDFRGVHKSRVYHFGSITTRKKIDSKNNYLGSKANIIFLKKWGFTIHFFEKFYLRSGYNKKGIIMNEYNGHTREPKKNIYFLLCLLVCKIKLFIAYI